MPSEEALKFVGDHESILLFGASFPDKETAAEVIDSLLAAKDAALIKALGDGGRAYEELLVVDAERDRLAAQVAELRRILIEVRAYLDPKSPREMRAYAAIKAALSEPANDA